MEFNLGGRPPMYSDPQEMAKKIEEYFMQSMTKAGKCQPTIEGLVFHLGFANRKALYDYAQKEGFSNIVHRAKGFIKSCYEKQLYGFAWAGASFALRNIGKEDWKEETDSNVELNATIKAEFGTVIQPPSGAAEDTQ